MEAILEALMIGALYYLAVCDITPWSRVFSQAVFYGLIFGLIYGDLTQGIILGATINALYLGLFATGGNLPSDQGMAACFAIPIALKYGLSAEVAVSLAVPFGVIGTFLDNLIRTINGVWNRMAQKHIEEGKYGMLKYDAVILPTVLRFVLNTIVMAIIAYLGMSNAELVLSYFPDWLMHALTVLGGVLPGLGFVLATIYLGRRKLLPFAVLGFFIYTISGASIVVLGVIGAMIALIYVGMMDDKKAVEA
ncbi:PTS sugar transporter subunit IIC [uncultured Enorma sp.]|jgi:D-glucosaminate-specific PTS system IIC component|uniref:PTS mannose/fructose/sorbose/N-acetylgalactosamine transporter subunit IIC n=1 Tax=uncultured Enorma sp. TaxID=1714346 RepID=UPI0025D5FB3F|nr:PTS sugar transporter subunit IIC [uncultured Enorma sp.]